MANNELLDEFGMWLMQNVRDDSIESWRMILSGFMKGESSIQTRAKLDAISPAARAAVSAVLPEIVDTVLHHLLWSLEQSDEITVGVHSGGQSTSDLKTVSDGLAGEVFTEEGWIARFSKEPEFS